MAAVVGGALRSRTTAANQAHVSASSVLPLIWAGIHEKEQAGAAAAVSANVEGESKQAMADFAKSFTGIGTAAAARIDAVADDLRSTAGFPPGLIQELQKTLAAVPLRIWLVDNSGSMRKRDGSTWRTNGAGQPVMHKASRWEEMVETLSFFAHFCEVVGARTDVHFLNQPGATPDILGEFYGLNAKEFNALVAHFQEAHLTAEASLDVEGIFSMYDTNRSGELSAIELKPALQRLLHPNKIELRTAMRLLHTFDTTKTQREEKAEWRKNVLLDEKDRAPVRTRAEIFEQLRALPSQYLSLANGAFPALPAFGPVGTAQQHLVECFKPEPKLFTPTALRLREVTHVIRYAAPELRANGQRVAVVLWTDGKPDKPKAFTAALDELLDLPVLVVIRMCTNDLEVVEYFEQLDRKSRGGDSAHAHSRGTLEVLDDVRAEAAEVRRINPWLTYGAPLHMLRELGCPNVAFDQLDEKLCTPSQLREVLTALTGDTTGVAALPEPSKDWAGFASQLMPMLDDLPLTLDVLRQRPTRWVDLDHLCIGFGPNVVLRLGGKTLPKNAFLVVRHTPSGYDSKEPPLATTEAAALGLVAEGDSLRHEATVIPRPHNATDASEWPEVRLPAHLPDDAPLYLEVLAWKWLDFERRGLPGIVPKLIGGAVLTLKALLADGGASTITLTDANGASVRALTVAEVAERSAAAQAAREAAQEAAAVKKPKGKAQTSSSACVLL